MLYQRSHNGLCELLQEVGGESALSNGGGVDLDSKPVGVNRLWTAVMVIILWVLVSLWASGEAPDSKTRLKVAEPPMSSSARMAPWPRLRVSTPAAEGIDPVALEEAYARADEIPHIYSMLVVRHGALVAERYFGEPQRESDMPVASVGKSIVGALVGIAVDRGLVVVTTADNFVGDFTDNSWVTEGGIMRLIGTHVIPAVE